MRPRSLVLVYILVALLMAVCAKKDSRVEFRPLQIHWILAEGEDDESISNKDNCVIRLTGRLMGEPPVQASPVEELEYRVIYKKSAENGEILQFEGICEDKSLVDRPECKWSATCDAGLQIVVKFHNEE